MHNRIKQQRVRSAHHVGLYSFVFAGKVSVMAVLLLFVSFLMQPFHQAFANENTPVEEVVVAEEVAQQEPVSESIDTTETAPVEATDINPESSSSNETTPAIFTDEQNMEDPGLNVTDTISGEPALTEIEITEDVEPEAGPEETDSGGNISDPDPGIPIDEIVDDDLAETNGTTTTPQDTRGDIVVSNEIDNQTENADPIVPAQHVVNDENYYQFSKQSCVAVGDGTYHCSTNTVSTSHADAVVYAEKDTKEGDMEIFLRTVRGDIEQLSDNTLDDTSPNFDAESMRVVWQRLIDGRQQIVVYDLDEGEESQLTFSRNNNMEPKVSDEGIVWQAWDGNDWEIMHFDGTYTDQITNNESQDVTPVIEDGYILWSILGSGNQEAKVYSLDSGETLTITGHEGGSIVNPRFVLVYDTRFENGDVVTQGFDPATGLTAPIAAEPAPEPIKIPDVDTIGEIRALIQGKTSQKEDVGPDGVKVDDGDDGLFGIVSTSSITASKDLDLKQPTFDDVPVVATSTPVVFELTEYDLVIAPQVVVGEGNTNSTVIMVSSASSTQP